MKILIYIAVVIAPFYGLGQDPLRFEEEIKSITARNEGIHKENLALFTGSSSVRLWKTLAEDFPNRNVLNTGFGGSEMSDLVYYFDQLILPYNPTQIFIYEGDNDLNSGKEPESILEDAKKLVALIREKLPTQTSVAFISPKPSIARAKLQDKYIRYNQLLKEWTSKNGAIFIDVWTPMLDAKGKLKEDLFIEDGLHMNTKGYAIWTKVIHPYLVAP